MNIRRAAILAALVVGVGATVTGTSLADAPSPCPGRELVQGQKGQNNTQHYCPNKNGTVTYFTKEEERDVHPETYSDTPFRAGKPTVSPESDDQTTYNDPATKTYYDPATNEYRTYYYPASNEDPTYYPESSGTTAYDHPASSGTTAYDPCKDPTVTHGASWGESQLVDGSGRWQCVDSAGNFRGYAHYHQ